MRRPISIIAGLIVMASLAPIASGASPAITPQEVTDSIKGKDLAVEVAARHSAHQVATRAADLRVWRLGEGDYFVGRRLPDNFKATTVTNPDGTTSIEVTYDVGVAASKATRNATAKDASLAAASPSWAFQDGTCFSRMGSEAFGFLDSCYRIHKLINESNSKDFYKLEQFGTVGAGQLQKIYDGWLKAVKASSGSSAMTWNDWSPRGSVTGGCQNLTLRVEVLGIAFTSPAFFCENNIPTKYEAAGSFKMQWSCGCVYPFGQPYPNSREIDYLQAVSVANGGAVRWTLSAGFTAR